MIFWMVYDIGTALTPLDSSARRRLLGAVFSFEGIGCCTVEGMREWDDHWPLMIIDDEPLMNIDPSTKFHRSPTVEFPFTIAGKLGTAFFLQTTFNRCWGSGFGISFMDRTTMLNSDVKPDGCWMAVGWLLDFKSGVVVGSGYGCYWPHMVTIIKGAESLLLLRLGQLKKRLSRLF